MNTSRIDLWNKIAPYLLATGLVSLAFFLKLAIIHFLQAEIPFLLFFSAIVLSGIFGGMRLGVFATILSAALSHYYFLLPAGTFIKFSGGQYLKIVLFLVDGLIISALCGRLKRSSTEVMQALRSNEEIEFRERKTNERFAEVLTHAPLIVWALDQQGTYTLVEGKALKDLGLSPSDLIGKNHFELYEGNITVLDNVQRALLGESFVAESNLKGRTFTTSFVPVFDSEGDVIGISAVSTDITDLKFAQSEVLIERNNFRNLFAQTPEMVCILRGPEHRFEFVNESHIFALGFDATGMTVRQAQPESIEVYGILDNVYQTGVTAHLHEIPVTLGTKLRYFDLTYSARRDNLGRIDGVMILGLEVTNQVEARNALKQSEDRYRELSKTLQESVLARDEFLSIASHELKTPLTSLRLKIQLHERYLKKGDLMALSHESVMDLLTQTDKQVVRLTRLVDDMLDVARIRSGKLDLKLESFDFSELVGEILERMQYQFTSASYSPPVFHGCDQALGEWDRFRMEQVLTNLLTNAIRYGNKNPIVVSCFNNKSQIRLEVQDQGIGIPEHLREKIFDRFERAINANEVSGLGLGLFITKQIVAGHGGRIWVESEPGKGSTFILELPKKK